MEKTVQVDDQSYSVKTITAGKGLEIQDRMTQQGAPMTSGKWTMAIVTASIGKTEAEVEQMPWTHYQALIQPALEVNGLAVKKEEATEGEAQAGESPAA